MAEETSTKRNKPSFLRRDWHKKIRLGRGVKKNQKWHGAKGRQNKIRMNRKGTFRPKIGWSAEAETRGFVGGMEAIRVENVKMLEGIEKGCGIIVGSVGKKKRLEIIKKAEEMKINVLNKYLSSIDDSGEPKAEDAEEKK